MHVTYKLYFLFFNNVFKSLPSMGHLTWDYIVNSPPPPLLQSMAKIFWVVVYTYMHVTYKFYFLFEYNTKEVKRKGKNNITVIENRPLN